MHVIRYDGEEEQVSGAIFEEVIDALAPGDSLLVAPTNHGEFKVSITVKDDTTLAIVMGTLEQMGVDDTTVTNE
jgi:hypothetical protein